jgi:phthalate 4,5-cis-dihydrodiol dehydrogenase
MLMLPTLLRHPGVAVVAAADPRPEARTQFERDFGGTAYPSVAALCADPALEAIYVATPHGLHLEHVRLAARAGKHVLVEKPMAETSDQGRLMIEAADRRGLTLMVDHTFVYTGAVQKIRELVDQQRLGRL